MSEVSKKYILKDEVRASFLVQGSAEEPYKVIFRKNGKNLTGHCSCPAGEVGQYCKHRLSILKGETKGIVSGNGNMVTVVISWLPGTDVETALKQVQETELEFEKLKIKLRGFKKKLARTLMD